MYCEKNSASAFFIVSAEAYLLFRKYLQNNHKPALAELQGI